MAATLFYDGFCLHCTAAARTVRRLDLGRRLRVVSFRHTTEYERYGITAAQLEEAMHLVQHRPRGDIVYKGFTAVQAVIRHLPLLWVFLPLCWFLGAAGLGDRAYRWLAANRLIVPDALRCRDEACPLPPRQED